MCFLLFSDFSTTGKHPAKLRFFRQVGNPKQTVFFSGQIGTHSLCVCVCVCVCVFGAHKQHEQFAVWDGMVLYIFHICIVFAKSAGFLTKSCTEIGGFLQKKYSWRLQRLNRAHLANLELLLEGFVWNYNASHTEKSENVQPYQRQKLPNGQNSSFKNKKAPNHKTDTAKRWCIPQMPSCNKSYGQWRQ